MRVPLTPALVAKVVAQPGQDRTIYWDARLTGFGLQVTAAGHKGYVVQYRANGISRRMSIDGVLSLPAARKRARALLGQVAYGGDPLGERRKREDAERNTLRAVALEFFAREGKALRSADPWRTSLERAVFPVLGSRPIAEVRRSEIARLLDKIEDERGPAAAHKTLAVVRRILRWHATRDDHFNSPIVAGMGRYRSAENARARILTDEEIRAVWRAAGEMAGPFGAFVKFLLLTSARRNEAARLTHDELDGADWILPPERNKTKAELVRPLSKAAQAVLAELPRFAGSPFVFSISGRTALRNFAKPKARLDAQSGVTGWTLHDLRRTARSLLSRSGIHPDISERCLGHTIGGVRGVYDRHDFHEQMAHAFEALAAQIERIIAPLDNVVAMRM
jgi:integrase